jgi:hypothetical protein
MQPIGMQQKSFLLEAWFKHHQKVHGRHGAKSLIVAAPAGGADLISRPTEGSEVTALGAMRISYAAAPPSSSLLTSAIAQNNFNEEDRGKKCLDLEVWLYAYHHQWCLRMKPQQRLDGNNNVCVPDLEEWMNGTCTLKSLCPPPPPPPLSRWSVTCL